MRKTIGNGMRQINLLLIPSSALLLVLATPITRLIYQHRAFGPHSTAWSPRRCSGSRSACRSPASTCS